MNILMIYVKNSLFEVPEKFNPIFTPIYPLNWSEISIFNAYLYSKFHAEFKSFFQIELPLFVFEIFKF